MNVKMVFLLEENRQEKYKGNQICDAENLGTASGAEQRTGKSVGQELLVRQGDKENLLAEILLDFKR